MIVSALFVIFIRCIEEFGTVDSATCATEDEM